MTQAHQSALRAWLIQVDGEVVSTTKTIVADAWRSAGLAVTELVPAAQCLHQIAEPVSADGWIQEGHLLYRLTDDRKPKNRDEISVTMADGSRTEEARTRRAGELLDAIRELAATQPAAQQFQVSVGQWLMECFGHDIAHDGMERNHRFLEEALELVQSLGCTASEAHQLVDYVFGRPVGEPVQELGGVMVTLAALCFAHELDMAAGADKELARICDPETMAKIKAKQAAKPRHSPLPQLAATQPAAQGLDAKHVEAVLLEHSGCGHNTQVDQLTVRLNPGDKVVLRKGRITQGYEKANAALAAQAKQGGA